MRNINKRVIVVVAVLVAAVSALYIWQATRGSLAGGGYLRAEPPEWGYFNLLLPQRGDVSFGFYGQQANVYIAHYERDELVLRELVTGLAFGGANEVNGRLIWGITVEEDQRRELRTFMQFEGGGVHAGHFDFSQIDFSPASWADSSATIGGSHIELGRRYVLHIWQTEARFWVDGDFFLPERLRENEKTTILYIVFE